MNEAIPGILLAVVMGIGGVAIGLYPILTGKRKYVYMAENLNTARQNAAIPLGVAFLIFALAGVTENLDVAYVILAIGIGIGIIGIIFSLFPPPFLKPAWFRWLEREHGDIMPLLQEEVQMMGERNWDNQMQTQEDLEVWVAEVRRKHGV